MEYIKLEIIAMHSIVHFIASYSLTLEVYILNLFFLILIQDDNELALESFEKNWSRKVKET